ncbi:glycerol-3-phosphate dehydrogenase/oxidase [Streptomyces sp. NBC_00211]|uniref:glycerol-3-phosphate dehydrogenase/oxidase n=1 Tax=Streptomyces sp. NBC_00211 TaxID=2975683 RepID=UPI00324E189E
MAKEELDILVIGGGVVGCGAALDAATRGMRVGLVEASDWASGSSSRSSKLIDGGVRNLEMLDVRLVAKALKERGLLLQRLAPHLVRPVPFLFPLQHRWWERSYVSSGILLYDSIGALRGKSRGLPHHRQLTRSGALREAPALRSDALVGAVQYWDAQVDDARHTMFLARTAASYGAAVANRAQVTRFLREGERVVGAVVTDLETHLEIEVRAKQVINATGVWTDDTQSMAGPRNQFHILASKGVHLLVPRDRINSRTGLVLRTGKSLLFVIPWGRHWIIGTTDTDWDHGKAHPTVNAGDIDYLLEHLNTALAIPLTAQDVEGVYAGLRPLLFGESAETSKFRKHLVTHPVPGLVTVIGGDYSTYRIAAKDAIDEAVRVMDEEVPKSATETVPLLGAEGYWALWNARRALAERSGLHVASVEHLLKRFGSMVHEVLHLIAEDPYLAQPLPNSNDYLGAEAVYAVTHEGARHLDDVLARRTRLSIESWDRGVSAARTVAELMAPSLGWSTEQVAHEVHSYLKQVEDERETQGLPSDDRTDAIALTASDIVPFIQGRPTSGSP